MISTPNYTRTGNGIRKLQIKKTTTGSKEKVLSAKEKQDKRKRKKQERQNALALRRRDHLENKVNHFYTFGFEFGIKTLKVLSLPPIIPHLLL